jgi:hypothetical protein
VKSINLRDDDSNDSGRENKTVLLPVSVDLKDKGVREVKYGGTFISIDFKGKLFTFTVCKEDVSKTHRIYQNALNHEIEEETKCKIWLECISSNWLKYIYTEEEIGRDTLDSNGKVEIVLRVAKKAVKKSSLMNLRPRMPL